MYFCFRTRERSRFEAMRSAFTGSVHHIKYEPEPGAAKASPTDAEYLSLGLAEGFGSTPPEKAGVAYIIDLPVSQAAWPARVITGVTLDGPLSPESEIRVVFGAIKRCVEKYNESTKISVDSVGIGDEFLYPSKVTALRLRQILSENDL